MIAINTASRSMKMSEVKQKAKSLGINPGKLKKMDLIHAIQTAEGCTNCFGNSNGHCQSLDCCFMHDCLKIKS